MTSCRRLAGAPAGHALKHVIERAFCIRPRHTSEASQ
jgi:hypothetical protein